MAQAKGGRKLARGRIRRAKTAFQVARTRKNKHNAAARVTRRKEFWASAEGKERKIAKSIKRKIKSRLPKGLKQPVPVSESPDAHSMGLNIPVLDLQRGTITGCKAEDVFLSGWENEGGLSV